jgi:hypothetical protein
LEWNAALLDVKKGTYRKDKRCMQGGLRFIVHPARCRAFQACRPGQPERTADISKYY